MIAYIDILATKSILNTADDTRTKEFIRQLRDIYHEMGASENANVRIFSDNILIFEEYSEDAVQRVVGMASQFQFRLIMENGLLCRGGILRGQLYYDDNFVIGKGLVDVYTIESVIAQSPRILVDETISDSSDSILLFENARIVDYLDNLIAEEDEYPNPTYLLRHRKSILENQAKVKLSSDPDESEKMKLKYTWLIAYHNYYCNLYEMDEKYLINESYIKWEYE